MPIPDVPYFRRIPFILTFGAWLLVLPTVFAQTPANSADKEAAAQAKREAELKMPEIFQAMGLKDGSKAADIGAGGGYYEISMSHIVGAGGRIYAEDIDEGSIKRLHERVDADHLANVEVIHGKPADPELPGSLDAVLMVIMYHEIEDYKTMLEHVRAALKSGGRLVIVDMPARKTLTRPRADQVKNHVIAPDLVQAEVQAAGFEVVSREDRFIDWPDEETTKWMIVFRKP